MSGSLALLSYASVCLHTGARVCGLYRTLYQKTAHLDLVAVKHHWHRDTYYKCICILIGQTDIKRHNMKSFKYLVAERIKPFKGKPILQAVWYSVNCFGTEETLLTTKKCSQLTKVLCMNQCVSSSVIRLLCWVNYSRQETGDLNVNDLYHMLPSASVIRPI